MLIYPLKQVPDLVALHTSDPETFPYLLQSSGRSGWDILMATTEPARLYHTPADAARFWQDLAGIDVSPSPASSFPFIGGWFVYLGYELLHALEPNVPAWPALEFPLAALTRVPAAVLFDRASGQAWVVAEEGAEALWREISARAESNLPETARPELSLALQEEDPDRYLAGVRRIRDYIYEGDVFQVNFSRAWHARLLSDLSDAQLYQRLRTANAGPFNALVNLGGGSIVSSSPERLLSVRDGKISTRPIAGTHPRSMLPEEDIELKRRLMASPKERAEHIMLIDLERNDLGRIAQAGSVKVEELMSVETYAFVHHIESVVSARLRPGLGPAQAIAALFPGGTITGCPKVRTMQIIRELEAAPRGAYTGSLGYINRDGSMDLNILIRSFMRQDDRLSFRAGAGIVADSDPIRELAETRAKAKGLLRALSRDHASD